MPYPNYHAAPLTPKTSTKDGKKYTAVRTQKVKGTRGILAKVGIYSDGGERKSTWQSIWFPKSSYTVAQARAWLKEHNYKPIKFEPAKESKGERKQVSEAKLRAILTQKLGLEAE